MLRGYHLRLERKEYKMRREMRMGRPPLPPRRQHELVLTQLYNQALELGLPNDQAARILTVAQAPRNSSAYGNPAFGSPAADRAAYGSLALSQGSMPNRSRGSNIDHQQLPAPSYGSSPYCSQIGNENYQQVAAPQMSNQYAQYAGTELAPPTASHFTSQASNVDYQQLPAPQVHEPYGGQYANAQLASSSPLHYVDRGTTYYTDRNTANQATILHGLGVSMEPIYGLGYSYSYENESYTPLNPIPEATETEHRYSHESYGPATYAGEPYVPRSYPDQPSYGQDYR